MLPSSEDCSLAVLLEGAINPFSKGSIDTVGFLASLLVTEYINVPPFPSPGLSPILAPATVIHLGSSVSGSSVSGSSVSGSGVTTVSSSLLQAVIRPTVSIIAAKVLRFRKIRFIFSII